MSDITTLTISEDWKLADVFTNALIPLPFTVSGSPDFIAGFLVSTSIVYFDPNSLTLSQGEMNEDFVFRYYFKSKVDLENLGAVQWNGEDFNFTSLFIIGDDKIFEFANVSESWKKGISKFYELTDTELSEVKVILL